MWPGAQRHRWLLAGLACLMAASFGAAASTPLSTESLFAYSEDVDIDTGGGGGGGTGTFSLDADRDSFVNQRSKTTNYGTLDEFAVVQPTRTVSVGGSNISVKLARGYVAFDLSSICSGAQLASATLTVQGPSSNDTDSLKIRTVGSSWAETSITWNSKPSSTEYVSVTDSEVTVSTAGGVTTVSVDVLSLLTDGGGALDTSSSAATHGWELRDADETIWYSRTNSTAALQPELTVVVSSCS